MNTMDNILGWILAFGLITILICFLSMDRNLRYYYVSGTNGEPTVCAEINWSGDECFDCADLHEAIAIADSLNKTILPYVEASKQKPLTH